MELMDTSLDKFYKFIYERLKENIPESILGKVTVAVSRILLFLQTEEPIISFELQPMAFSFVFRYQFLKNYLLFLLRLSSEKFEIA